MNNSIYSYYEFLCLTLYFSGTYYLFLSLLLKITYNMKQIFLLLFVTLISFSCKEKKASGKEYTSTYICPMHCEGSGSDKPGICPVCKMDYVKNEESDHDHNGHDHEGHDHDHDGHDHNHDDSSDTTHQH